MNFQDELKAKTDGRLYMYYQSKIITGTFSYLQGHDDKNIEGLFSIAIDLFNALGSWIYGGISPKIVYPVLQLFVKKSNASTAESFSHLLGYINWNSKNLYKILENNQWIEEPCYENYTLKKSNDVTTGLFFMWRLGRLIVEMTDISNEKDIPIPKHVQNALNDLFDAFGNWIYHQEGIVSVTQSLQRFENLFGEEFDPLYDGILEEIIDTRKNIAKFLQNLSGKLS
ncbi:MAG: hypothetical protein ACFE8G_11235 [Candidatus Hermodarchaeota archaeon]